MIALGERLAARLAALRLWPMLRKEFIQMRRDRLTVAMLVGIPAVQLVLFGFAIRMEVRNLPTVVLDESRSRESRALVDVIRNTGNFEVAGTVASRAEVERAILSGRARAAVIIPPDFHHDVARRRGATAQVIVDAADPLASQSAISGAAQAGAARAQAIVASRAPGAAGRALVPVEVRVRPWYNPALRSATYIVPGIIGVLLSMTMVIITAMAVVRERERGTLEQLVVTPLDRTSIMLGKLLPFALVGYVQMTVILVLGRLLFDVPVRGSLLELYALALPFIVASLGVGLLVSTVARTQAQAMQLGFFYLLPNILLSGFMFPREAMPPVARWLGNVLPLTWFLRVLRGALLKGAGLVHLWPDGLALALIATLFVTASVIRFRKTVE